MGTWTDGASSLELADGAPGQKALRLLGWYPEGEEPDEAPEDVSGDSEADDEGSDDDAEDTDEVAEEDVYDSMTKPQLQGELKERGLAKTGTVEELRDRLREDDAPDDDE